MDQRWVSYSRRDSQLRWSNVWKKYWWEQNGKTHLHSLYQTTVPTFKLHSVHWTYRRIVTMNWQWWIWKRTIHSQIFEGKTCTLLHTPTGCYELKAINAEITHIRGKSDITILPNVNTLQCILTVVGAKCKVSFDVPNSLASVLSFKQDIAYGVELVNIMSVNSILVHCNTIHSSYMRGQQAPVVYNFFPNTTPGQKILEAPHNLIYLPVTIVILLFTLLGWYCW